MKILKFVKSALVFRLREGHICALLIHCARVIYNPLERNITYIFFKDKLRKYVIIRLHHLKIDTVIAHIEPLQN
jgi:hypothetical protein